MPVDAARCRIVRERISPPSLPLSPPRLPSIHLANVWRLPRHRWAPPPPPSSSSPLPPPTLPPTLLRFLPLPPPSSATLLCVPFRSSQEEHGSQAGDPSVHTLALATTPRHSPPLAPLSLSLYFPDTSLPLPRFFPPSPGASPPRCILNQSLGGNAITRHHDASTIFYFKLLYVLVPPPCLSPIPLVSRRRCAVPSRHPRVMSVPVTPPAPQRCSSVSSRILSPSLYGPLLSSAPSVLPRQPGYTTTP